MPAQGRRNLSEWVAAALLGRDVMISGGKVGDWAVLQVQVMPQEEPGVSFRLSSQINSYEVLLR